MGIGENAAGLLGRCREAQEWFRLGGNRACVWAKRRLGEEEEFERGKEEGEKKQE